MEGLTSTSDNSTALTPAGELGGNTDLSVSTSGDTTGVAQVAQTALDQASGQAADPIATALSAIPADDNDLTTIADAALKQSITQQRSQLRVLGDAVRELQPLRIYQQYGDPKVVENRLNIAKLLYTPVMENGKPVRDPATQTIRITTKPFVDYLDRTSPGLPEQLLVDLLALVTENPTMVDATGQAIKEPLINQVFRFYKLDPRRLAEYQNIDARIARSSGAVTVEELAEIPSKYHAAYRTIPPSIRAAWKSYEEADQTRMLEDYKERLDTAERERKRAEDDKRRQAADDARHAQLVADKQDEYFASVRKDRTASMIQSLSQQVTFSADPAANKVMIGSLVSSMAQLLDRDWRFLVEEEVLAPLGLKLDQTFDDALDRFETNAAESVALELAGHTERARLAREESISAANQLTAKMAVFALRVAAKQGATVLEKAAVQAANLAVATAGRPNAGNGQVAGTNGRLLPDGVRPGSPEAARYLAHQTGLFKETAG